MARAHRRLLALGAIAAGLMAGAAHAAPVLLISLDGLQPADILEAEQRGIKVPTLRQFMREGAYARGVTGVLPTLTYPSHATLITGTSPARHGISNNLTFDPTEINQTGWYWYASDYRVPTLWDAAEAEGMVTANVHWPVSVGARVDHNLPQLWRTGHDDDRKLMRALATPGLLPPLEAKLGDYAQGIDETVAGDANRVRFAARILQEKRPDFMTVYLAGIDHVEHRSGGGSPEAKKAIEQTDALVAELVQAAQANDPETVIAVVSDHGFLPVSTDVNLFRPFLDAGLITLSPEGKVTAWEAQPWLAGGSAAVVLARPEDATLKAKVKRLLDSLAANPTLGISRVIERDEIARRGGAQEASFFLEFKPGFQSGRSPTAPPTSTSSYKGMHGHFPDVPELRASLFVMGPGLRKRGDLGEVDMRDVAPSLARILGVSLPQAEGKPVF